jgi:hypothetical protein
VADGDVDGNGNTCADRDGDEYTNHCAHSYSCAYGDAYRDGHTAPHDRGAVYCYTHKAGVEDAGGAADSYSYRDAQAYAYPATYAYLPTHAHAATHTWPAANFDADGDVDA